MSTKEHTQEGARQDLDGTIFRRRDSDILAENNSLDVDGCEKAKKKTWVGGGDFDCFGMRRVRGIALVALEHHVLVLFLFRYAFERDSRS